MGCTVEEVDNCLLVTASVPRLDAIHEAPGSGLDVAGVGLVSVNMHGGEAGGDEVVKVVFSLPGDDIGSPESAAQLERVKAAILERGAGEVLGSGFGMGSMELVVRLRGANARAALEEAVRQAHPAAKFRIEPGPSP